jgi:hypothetical protein
MVPASDYFWGLESVYLSFPCELKQREPLELGDHLDVACDASKFIDLTFRDLEQRQPDNWQLVDV